MKFLCLVDRYYPDSSANTICCENIAEILKSLNHEVDFLAIKNSPYDKDFDVINGSNVIKIETYQHKLLRKYGEKYNAKTWTDFPWIFRRFNGVLQKLKIPFKPLTSGLVSLDTLNARKILRKIQKVSNHYDCIITFSMPYEFILISDSLMKCGLADKWYPIFLDAYVFNETLSNLKISYRKRLAKKSLKRANHIFMVEGILKANLKKGYKPEYHKKTTEIYIPMLKKFDVKEKTEKSSKTTLCYCGGFYRDIRNPEKMLQILSKLKDVEIRWFGSGCEDIVEKEKTNFKNCELFIGGKVGHDKCLKELTNADILINLGNSITNQMPSKIFEYIAMGKPIINFYFNEEDMCLPILEKYSLAVNINLNNTEDKTVKFIEEFINKNKGVVLSYKEATKELEDYKVENVAKKILKIIEK